jgi:hypothetical protein
MPEKTTSQKNPLKVSLRDFEGLLFQTHSYYRVRLHSSLDYKSPIEFEQVLQTKNGGKIESFLSKKT